MEKLPLWSESCLVRFGAVDKSDSMTLNSIFNFFQEAAISHAESLGVGREDRTDNRYQRGRNSGVCHSAFTVFMY